MKAYQGKSIGVVEACKEIAHDMATFGLSGVFRGQGIGIAKVRATARPSPTRTTAQPEPLVRALRSPRGLRRRSGEPAPVTVLFSVAKPSHLGFRRPPIFPFCLEVGKKCVADCAEHWFDEKQMYKLYHPNP